MTSFKWSDLSDREREIALSIVGSEREPDLNINPDGKPYLYRWYVVKRTARGNVYFHIQVADDPERPLHDHPWDNQSVILYGGYDEVLHPYGGAPDPTRTRRHKRELGDVIHRRAEWSHRLLMPKGNGRTMTLFSTGPKVHSWGFWYPDGFRPYEQVTRLSEDGKTSIHIPLEGGRDVPVG